eukprot:1464789-Amphidinium_carterae.4
MSTHSRSGKSACCVGVPKSQWCRAEQSSMSPVHLGAVGYPDPGSPAVQLLNSGMCLLKPATLPGLLSSCCGHDLHCVGTVTPKVQQY